MPSTVPKHKTIPIQFSLGLLTLHETIYRHCDRYQIQGVNNRPSVGTHNEKFEHLEKHEHTCQEAVDHMPQRVVGHVDIVSEEGAWAL